MRGFSLGTSEIPKRITDDRLASTRRSRTASRRPIGTSLPCAALRKKFPSPVQCALGRSIRAYLGLISEEAQRLTSVATWDASFVLEIVGGS